MEFKAPQVYENAVRNIPEDKSPIFYADVLYNILKTRGRAVTRLPFKAERRVIKGLKADFGSDEMKRTALKDYFGYERDKTQFKKVVDFDLTKVEIRGIIFKRFLGYGIKSS